MVVNDKNGRPRISTSFDPPVGPPDQHTYRDGKNGYGYSEPGIVEDGYAYASNDTLDFGSGLDARSPGVIMPAGAITETDLSSFTNIGAVSDSFVLGGSYYLLAGRLLIKVLSGYSTVSQVADLGAGGNLFDQVAVGRFSGTLYAWLGCTLGFAKYDGTTFTSTTSFVRDKMSSVRWDTTDGVAAQRLVSSTGANYLHCALTTDPMTSGNWSATTPVDYPVLRIVSTGRHAYLSTLGGVYDVDDLGQPVNLSPYTIPDDRTSPNQGVAAYAWDGNVLYGALTGLDAVDISQPGIKQQQANYILPGDAVGIPNETPIYGTVQAFTNDGGWVVASVYNGTDSYILYGKRRARLGFPGPGEWIWHGALAVYRSMNVNHLRVTAFINADGVLERRLWAGAVTHAGAIRLFHQSLPVTTTARQDSLNSTPHRYGTAGTLYLTPTHFQSPGQQHSLTQGLIESRNADSTHTLALAASSDGGSYGSTLLVADESPVELDALTSPGGTFSVTTGHQIAPKLTFTGTATTPTVLVSLSLWATTDPLADEVWDATVTLVREQDRNSGARPSHQNVERTYQLLVDMLGTIVTLTGPTGDTYTAVLEGALQGSWVKIANERDGARGWQREIGLRLRIVDRPARFGETLFGLPEPRLSA